MQTRSASLGLVFAVVGAVCFSFKAIFVKLAYRYGVDAETLLALRMGYALPFFIAMGVAVTLREPMALTRHDWALLTLLGFLGYYISSYLDFLGLRHISAALERLILFIYPTVVLLASALFLRKPIPRGAWWPLGLSYVGVALAVSNDLSPGNGNLVLGCLLVFGSTLSYASYLMISGEEVRRLGAMRVAAFATGFACLCSLTQFFVLRSPSALLQPWPVHAYGLAMALLSTVAPIWLIAEAMRRIGAGRTSMIGMLGPALTILFGWVFLGEQLGPLQILGAVLVMGGVALVAKLK